MPSWSRDEIREFVRGKLIYARDPQAGTVAAPDWLLAASEASVPTTTSAAAMETTHPEDRPILIKTFIEALSHPGTVVRGPAAGRRVRRLGDDHHRVAQPDGGPRRRLPDLHDRRGRRGGGVRTAGDRRDGRPSRPPGGWSSTSATSVSSAPSTARSRETIGYEPKEMVGRLISEFLHHDSLADGITNWFEVKSTAGSTSTSRRPWKRKDGGHIWLEASYLNRGENSIMAVVWDITEKRKQEQELADLTAQFQVLADEVPAAVFRCDLDGTVLFHNARWSKLIEDRVGRDAPARPDRRGRCAPPVGDARRAGLGRDRRAPHHRRRQPRRPGCLAPSPCVPPVISAPGVSPSSVRSRT